MLSEKIARDVLEINTLGLHQSLHKSRFLNWKFIQKNGLFSVKTVFSSFAYYWISHLFTFAIRFVGLLITEQKKQLLFLLILFMKILLDKNPSTKAVCFLCILFRTIFFLSLFFL